MTDNTTDYSEIRRLRSLRVELSDFVERTEGRLQTLANSLAQYVDEQPLADAPVDIDGTDEVSADVHVVEPEPNDPLGRLNAIKQRLAKQIDNRDA